VTLYYTFDGY
jgi:hypothetical protein